jgi:hypothetical protein
MRVLPDNSTETVGIDHVMEARAQMIEARETHLDALGVRLRNLRVKRIIQTILTGGPRQKNSLERKAGLGYGRRGAGSEMLTEASR